MAQAPQGSDHSPKPDRVQEAFAQNTQAHGEILGATLGFHFCFNFQWFLFESFMAARYNCLLSILAWLLIFVWAVKLSCNSMKFHHNFRFLWEGNFSGGCNLVSSTLHSFDF